MKYDPHKTFPYPVLRPQSDDYLNAEFQATVELAVGRDRIHANIIYAISSEEIACEIAKGNAEYVCIVACRDTYFRSVLCSFDDKNEAYLSIGDLRGEVRVDPYVVANKRIIDFASDDINPEFGGGPFTFDVGDILAQDEPQVFYIDREMFKPVTSLFDLVKKDSLSDKEWNIGFDQDHVQIEVSPTMKKVIDDARNTRSNKAILLNSIYFGAVMQAVQKLKTSLADYSVRKWADVILKQAHNRGCNFENQDAYLITQQLMQYPLVHLKDLFSEGDGR